MIHKKEFDYTPHDTELEKASNGYVMSLVAVMVGLPLPIINLIATFIFFMGQRHSTYFVRWHTTQALLSQFSLFVMNVVAFRWTVYIIFQDSAVNDLYIAYMLTVFLYNLTEFIATIYTAVKVRKGQHLEWFFYGPLTHEFVKS
ncbi:MAG: DUF4870 domain-containing protein [Saprospiraceae bacterium]|nr:DUF4870 domain-containing protein [Saprospiraceae bacterium]